MIFIAKCARQVVIAMSAAKKQSIFINILEILDCFVGCAASQ